MTAGSLSPDRPKRLVLVGAGSAVFTRGLLADLISAPDLGAWRLELVDVDADALGVAVRLAERMVVARGEQERIAVSGSLERRDVLPGADVVICSIGVGGRPGWLRDWEVAAEFGVFQPVGDSVMPGGISRALRTIPVMAAVARDVAELCPGAMLFNYGNPMTANVRAMAREHDEVVGLCHGLGHVHRELSTFAEVPHEETSILYCGLNHLTWIYDFRRRGEDLWPAVRAKLDAERDGRAPDPDALGQIFNDGARWDFNPFSWELFSRYGAYPSASDRHVTEFFPERFPGRGSYYGKTLGEDAYSLPEILAWGEARYETMRREADGGDLDAGMFERSSGDQEELIDILRSIMVDGRRISSVNVPNRGHVANLPASAVVEIPGVATARGLRPMSVPDFPDTLAAIVERRLASVELTVAAALRGDRGLVVEALLADGAVHDPDVAARMADAFIAAQADHLPLFA